MKNKWELIHDEELSPDRTLAVFFSRYDNGEPKILFESNARGLRIRYYSSAQDVINDECPLADICYGENSLRWEAAEQDAFMDEVFEYIPAFGPMKCSHAGISCEERFHEAQVALGNEETDDCASCQKLVEA
jgi:hypothetical protein